jgi:tRNA (guanine37-N1)-methyltransferase
MKFDIVTIFPRMVEGPLQEGIVARAIAKGLLDVRVHDLRDFTTDRHRVVDDVPFGGGPGMVLKPEPLFAAVDRIRETRAAEAGSSDRPEGGRGPRDARVAASAKVGDGSAIVLTSPDGARLTHAVAHRLSTLDHLVVLCGRYEGVDERVREHLATETISIGDYVLSGGELAALVIVDAVARLVPGVVGDEASVARDTFARGGLLDFPQYTRPAEFRGYTVPAVLLSGHHGEIDAWRREQAIARTRSLRPDLLNERP